VILAIISKPTSALLLKCGKNAVYLQLQVALKRHSQTYWEEDSNATGTKQ